MSFSTSSAFDLRSPNPLPLLSAAVHVRLSDEDIDEFNAASSVELRSTLDEAELSEIRTLHTEWFPVAYNEEFYSALTRNDDQVLKVVACMRSCIVGLATVAVRRKERQYNPNEDLLPFLGLCNQTTNIAYILTLGVVDELRRKGLGRSILEKTLSEVEQGDPQCKVIMLHVITYNKNAMRLYTKLGFEQFKIEPNFYFYADQWYDGILFYKRINQARERTRVSDWLQSKWRRVAR